MTSPGLVPAAYGGWSNAALGMSPPAPLCVWSVRTPSPCHGWGQGWSGDAALLDGAVFGGTTSWSTKLLQKHHLMFLQRAVAFNPPCSSVDSTLWNPEHPVCEYWRCSPQHCSPQKQAGGSAKQAINIFPFPPKFAHCSDSSGWFWVIHQNPSGGLWQNLGSIPISSEKENTEWHFIFPVQHIYFGTGQSIDFQTILEKN